MSAPWKPTAAQRALLFQLVRQHLAGDTDWHRAASAGERVTLASLASRGMLVRRAWRGAEGQADSAFEYAPAPAVLEAMRASAAEVMARLRKP